MPKDSQDGSSTAAQAMFAASDAVLVTAVLAGLGIYGGNWLDSKFNTSPWLAVVLALLGTGLGLYRMVRKASTMDQGSSDGTGTSAQPRGIDTGESSGEYRKDTSPDYNNFFEDLQDSQKNEADKQQLQGKERTELKPKSAFDFLNQGEDEK